MQNSELFELIKSLNKNEKRYFRMQASMQKGSKNYIQLFDAIYSQKTYDEKAIKEKYRGDKFIKHLAFTKNHLYSLIMKSLINYNSEKSVDSRIHSIISECKILFDKELYKKYFKTIGKAKKLALKYERFGYMLQILDMEKIIIRKEEIQTLKSESIYFEAVSAIEKLRNMFEYSRISANLLTNYRRFGIRRERKQDKLPDKVLSKPVMKNIDNALSDRSKESFYRIHEIISETKGEYEKMLRALEGRYGIVSKNPLPFEDYIIDYQADILFSLVNTSLKMNNLPEAERYLHLTRNVKINSEADKADYETFYISTELQIHLKNHEINKAVKLISRLEEILTAGKDKMLIDTELLIRFYIITARILEGNFSAALAAVNSFLAHPFIDKRNDLESYAMILNLIIHFELKNYPLLRYLLISAYRYFYKREKLFKLEQLIIEFIRRLPKVKNDDDLIYSFIQFRKGLRQMKKDEYEKNAFEYFDFLEWIDGKIPVKT